MTTTTGDTISAYPQRSFAKTKFFGGLLFSFSLLANAQAQTAPEPTAAGAQEQEDETIVLSPFVVDASRDRGYQATSTLAGTRIRTDLADVGSSISVVTKEMLTDLGATNNETVLAYTVNTEVGGPRGNFSGGVTGSGERYQEQALFANPNGNTRVRGLTSADNTRNYFLTDVPWDGYTVSRVDLQRGPNAILFGLGSPAGVVNATTSSAEFRNRGRVEIGFDRFSSQRYVLDYNRELIPKQLAIRFALLRNDQKFRQKPAFSLDERLFGTLTYRPEFLNRNGNHLEVTGNYEYGNLTSNRPRIVPPTDYYTPFWDPLSKGGVNKQVFDPYSSDLNPNNNPNIGGGGLGSILQLRNSHRANNWVIPGANSFGAMQADGSISDQTQDQQSPFTGGDAVGIETFPTFANGAGLPFADFGQYFPRTMTDPSVYDFYNKLLDGDNKREFTDWQLFQVNLRQDFLDESLGYELAHFQQNLTRGQWSYLGWDNSIFMDINSTTSENTPNPDVGRAYVQVENRDIGAGKTHSDREATRFSVFGKYDFAKRHEGVWARILGMQTVNGLYSEEGQRSDSRSFRMADLDPGSKMKFARSGWIEGDGQYFINSGWRYYLSDDKRGQATAANSHLSNINEAIYPVVGGPAVIRYFDKTWIAPASVLPGAAWTDPWGRTDRTQAENPANYRGWSETTANFVTVHSNSKIDDMSAEDYLTSSGTLVDFDVKSSVAVWQGYFWDRSIVGTFGYREDRARSYIWLTADRQGTGRTDTNGADLRPATYNYDNPDASIEHLNTRTKNWSIAAHLNRILGKHDFLPVNVSLYYNKGENFQPLAGRIDAFGRPLTPPSGKTEEKSVLIATKDNKYSLRATEYETSVLNANSTGSVGNMWALEQVLFDPANYARRWRAGDVLDADWAAAGGDVNQLRNVILPAWFQFEKDMVAQFPDYVNSWINKNGNSPWGTESNGNVGAGAPAGFAFTEDSVSKGYEFEFIANPTNNWRVAINGSKTTATRENVPGVAFKEVAAFVNDKIQNTPVGMAPMWWATNTGGIKNTTPWQLFRPGYLANAALNGQSALEVRKWRWNAISNYTFTEGPVKGFGVGAGLRYEDRAIVGYSPMKTQAGDNAIDLSSPFYTPSQTTFDLWLSYERKINKDINWRIQLNVYNVGGKNELTPISASVDYEKLGNVTPTAGMKIPMKASGYTIREGMSWQITNTFEF